MTQFLRTPWILVSTVATIAILMTGCGKGQQAMTPAASADTPAPSATDVATVNGTPITKEEYDQYLKSLLRGKAATDLTPDEKNQVLDQLVVMQLLSSQAAKDGMEKDPETAARLNVLRLQVLADGEAQKYLKGITPTDAELHAEYDAQVAGTDKTEYKAQHILVAAKDKELADSIIKKLKGGAKFDDLAKANSIDPGSKANGGDLGWFTLARMVKPFGDAVKGLKKGEVTPQPVQTQYGWHVIKLEDTRDTQQQTFEQFDKKTLSNAVIQKKFQAYLESLKKDAKIDKKPV